MTSRLDPSCWSPDVVGGVAAADHDATDGSDTSTTHATTLDYGRDGIRWSWRGWTEGDRRRPAAVWGARPQLADEPLEEVVELAVRGSSQRPVWTSDAWMTVLDGATSQWNRSP